MRAMVGALVGAAGIIGAGSLHGLAGQAQAPTGPRFATPAVRAPLFFREIWRQSRPFDASTNFRPEGGVTTAAVTNAQLELKIYDPNAKNVAAYKANPPA